MEVFLQDVVTIGLDQSKVAKLINDNQTEKDSLIHWSLLLIKHTSVEQSSFIKQSVCENDVVSYLCNGVIKRQFFVELYYALPIIRDRLLTMEHRT